MDPAITSLYFYISATSIGKDFDVSSLGGLAVGAIIGIVWFMCGHVANFICSSVRKDILEGEHLKKMPEQLNKIFELYGTPDEINWPGVSKIQWYSKFKPARPMKRRVREAFRHFDRHALDLLDKMLTLDPSQRITAKDALDAEYFWTDPLPCDPRSLPKYESSHEFQTKKKRQQQRQNEELAKKNKLQHPQQHARLPPIQPPGQSHQPRWGGPNHPPLASGPNQHQFGKPRGASGPTRYPPAGNPGGSGYYQDAGGQGGYSAGGPYPPAGRGPPYPASGPSANGPRGATGGYAPPPSYPQGGQYGGSGRNQQYGWQQ